MGKFHEKNIGPLHFLDLCSGVGVVGLEIEYLLNSILHCDFLEVQNIYREYFERNRKELFPHRTHYTFLSMNYRDVKNHLELKGKYHGIFCNPPYFFPGEGLLSPSEFKNRCRFFLDGSFEELFESIIYLLHAEGIAYILVRSHSERKKDPLTTIQNFSCLRSSHFVATLETTIRGVLLIKIQKNHC